MALIIKTELNKEKGKVIFFLDGELDLSTAQIFKDTVEEEYRNNPGNIDIDFTHIDFIDSTCLGVMVSLSKQMKEGHKICIYNLKDHIKKVFTITGLDRIFICEGEW